IEAPGSEGLGKPLADLVPGAPEGVTLETEYSGGADVVIDFSFHTASAALAEKAAALGTPIVIGTTGLTADEKSRVEAAAGAIPVLVAPNMSVGANVLFDIAARMARMLGADFDIEIIEAHHRFKKDAPSGTALEAARRVAAARGLSEKDIIFGRHGETGARPTDQIAVHAIRAGDIVGDHTVLFSCLGERLELVHRAHTRDAFARGAVRAARWLVSRSPGLYSYEDVLRGGGRQA
ncbi:MAG: 4-hydroxy-tetrahydrodipicolinate reductase, partial [Planctomycetota bacterium]